MSLSKMNGCGVVLPHLHPRGAQIYYIIKGNFQFGFVQENGPDALFRVFTDSIVSATFEGQKININKNQIQTIDPAMSKAL
jgi:hypothetical protein